MYLYFNTDCFIGQKPSNLSNIRVKNPYTLLSFWKAAHFWENFGDFVDEKGPHTRPENLKGGMHGRPYKLRDWK